MSQTLAFINRLQALKEGERSRLRRLAGQPLDKTLEGFDLFSGLWWPLRQASPVAPRRETSWLIAKLHGDFGSSVPHVRPTDGHGPVLAAVLGLCEPQDPPEFKGRDRFRIRFDTILCSSLSNIEMPLRWALDQIARAVAGRISHERGVRGIDWAQLLDDLSIWDRSEEHRRHRDIRDLWAEQYLNPTDHQAQGAGHAD
ncbi:type I-E CRISPR-associated protein Cse2/CasB [Fontivita pretiosa]|uniref:type I-E CRISPR-associated protein Cse2/CasB n=1 Tax=Fontivita pretiosa TaxID=2989684 RepID=UPI003D174D86